MSTEQRTSLIFLHGSEGSSQGFKAQLLRRFFPRILTPDFGGPLEERMAALVAIRGDQTGWIIIGSSFGGLMGALFTCAHPEQVAKLILLAPALIRSPFADAPLAPVSVPTVIYHGARDTIIPLEPARALARQVFLNLTFHVVDDDHGLRQTVLALDWPALVRT